jgi:hypothetical protein
VILLHLSLKDIEFGSCPIFSRYRYYHSNKESFMEIVRTIRKRGEVNREIESNLADCMAGILARRAEAAAKKQVVTVEE